MKKVVLILLFISIYLYSFCQNINYNINTKPINNTDTIYKSDFIKQFPFINMVDWKPGMKFMTKPIKDKKMNSLIGSYLRMELSPYKSKNPDEYRLKHEDFQWETFIYEGLEMRIQSCPRGKCINTYLIFNCNNKKYEYKYYGDTTELRKAAFQYIEGLVYLDEIDVIKPLIIDKNLFILTDVWCKNIDNGEEKFCFNNPKYVEVKIISIGLGSEDGPCKIIFKQIGSEDEYFLNIRFSGINRNTGVFGNDFDKVFQLDDPKLKYPNISSEIWTIITNGKVKIGMNKIECELSWGKPKTINKTITGNDVTEQWVYNISRYLYFKNGILETIQN